MWSLTGNFASQTVIDTIYNSSRFGDLEALRQRLSEGPLEFAEWSRGVRAAARFGKTTILDLLLPRTEIQWEKQVRAPQFR